MNAPFLRCSFSNGRHSGRRRSVSLRKALPSRAPGLWWAAVPANPFLLQTREL